MTEEEKPLNILIIGISGGLAQILCKLLSNKYPNARIVGVDVRRIPKIKNIPNLETRRMKYSRGQFEALFREDEYEIVYHLGRISHSTRSADVLTQRLNLNVMGTSRIIDLSLRFNVKKVIILSTFHVYGAYSDNSVFLNEDAPLRASLNHPELRDVVEMDQICTNLMWKYQNQISIVVFRPCNIIGPQVNNTMTQFLRSNPILKPIDYDPTFQFIHEFDMANVLSEAMKNVPTGIYNVATDDFESISKVIELLGSRTIPLPLTILSPVSKFLEKVNFTIPSYLIDYLKFSCLIDNSEIKKYLGDDFFRFDISTIVDQIQAS